MVGRGKARATRAGPAHDAEPAEQAPQYLIDLLAPMTARMQALEDRLAGGREASPPRRQTIVPQVQLAAPAIDQEAWLRLIERYQKFRAPDFQGGSDPLVADKWREDVGNILSLMGVDPVQRQRLATFSLKGDASK